MGWANATAQIPCEAGTYQDETGKSSCEQPSNGYYSPGTVGGLNVDSSVTTVATSDIPCAAGTYSIYTAINTSADSVSCSVAAAGYSSLGTYELNGVTYPATSQTACSAGTFQALTGQSSCDDADSGYYSPGTVGGLNVDSSVTTVATSEIPCAAGTYIATSGASSCTDAAAGTYSNGTISVNGVMVPATSETDCGSGTYQADTGQSSCDDTDAGYYYTAKSATRQLQCEAAKCQNDTAQTS